jgi:hypothetical protein
MRVWRQAINIRRLQAMSLRSLSRASSESVYEEAFIDEQSDSAYLHAATGSEWGQAFSTSQSKDLVVAVSEAGTSNRLNSLGNTNHS